MDNLPEKPIDIYENPGPRPEVQWVDFPKDMRFEDFQARAESFGMHHTPIHGRLLFDSAKSGHGEGWIVELGTYWGCGAAYLASGSKTAGREKVITIDIDRGHIWSLYSTQFYDRPPVQIFRSYMNLIMMGVYDWVIPIRGSSIEISRILDISIRVLHVDAEHTFNAAAWDILSWKEKLIPGGIIIFHDYSMEGVEKAVKEYVQQSDEFSDVIVLDIMTAYAIKR